MYRIIDHKTIGMATKNLFFHKLNLIKAISQWSLCLKSFSFCDSCWTFQRLNNEKNKLSYILYTFGYMCWSLISTFIAASREFITLITDRREQYVILYNWFTVEILMSWWLNSYKCKKIELVLFIYSKSSHLPLQHEVHWNLHFGSISPSFWLQQFHSLWKLSSHYYHGIRNFSQKWHQIFEHG